MNTKEIDGLVTEFTFEADAVKKQLSDMLGLVSIGKVPLKHHISEFDETISILQKKYESICSLTKEFVSETELPPCGSAVSDYIRAVNCSEKRRIAEKLIEVSSIIKRFNSVRSLVATYTEAIEPYQKEAAIMLKELDDVSTDDIPDKIVEASNAHRLFLTAMTVNDFDSESGIAILDKLEKAYPNRVQIGLARKKYFIADQELWAGAVEKLCYQEPDREETPDVIDTMIADSSSETENMSPDIFSSEEDQDDTPMVQISSRSIIKSSNPSASVFKADIIKMPKEVRTILPLFTNYGILRTEDIFFFGNFMDGFGADITIEKIEQALDCLISKGYVLEYEIEGTKDPRYCLSYLGYSCMHKESIAVRMRSFWNIAYGRKKVIGKSQLELGLFVEEMYHQNLVLKYIKGTTAQKNAEDYNILQKTIVWKGDHFQAAVFWCGKRYDCKITDFSEDDDALCSGNILFISDELSDVKSSEAQKLFALVKDTFYILDGNWVAMPIKNGCSDENQESHDVDPEETGGMKRKTVEIAPADICNDYAQEHCNMLLDNAKEKLDDAVASEESSSNHTLEAVASKVSSSDLDYLIEIVRNKNEDESPVEKSRVLLDLSNAPTDKQFTDLIWSLLTYPCIYHNEWKKKLTQAVLLAKAASYIESNVKSQDLYRKLLFATNMPLDEIEYSGMAISSAFGQDDEMTEGMMLSAYLFALLSPHQAFDYTLQAQASSYHNDYEKVFPSFPNLKPLFHKLLKIQDIAPAGFSDSVISLLGDAAESAAFVRTLQEKARALLSEPIIKTKMHGLPEFCSACFGPQSELHFCMEVIANNKQEERDLVIGVLSEYCTLAEGRSGVLDSSLLEDRIDKEWSKATKGKSTSRAPLSFLARKQAVEAFRQRLGLIQTWSDLQDQKGDYNLPALRWLKAELLRLLEDAMNENENYYARGGQVVLWMLEVMHQRLSGKSTTEKTFAHLLKTGFISLDDNWIPILDHSQKEIKYYEPWRNVLYYITASEMSYEEVKRSIFDESSHLFDNLHQLELIGRLLNDNSDEYEVTDLHLQEACDTAEEQARSFMDKLELAYTYGRIEETEKESLAAVLAQQRETFFATKDFGCWRRFLQALERQIVDISTKRKRKLRSDLNTHKSSCPEGKPAPLLEEAERLLELDCNFAVAEEYINRFDNGEQELSRELQAILHDKDSFDNFISDEVFDPIYGACIRGAGRALKAFGAEYLEKNLPKDWTARLKEDSKKMVANWPTRKDTSTTMQIQALFTFLGLNSTKAEKIAGQKEEMYYLHVLRTARNLADYRHPIASFGTQMKSPLPIVILYGNYTAKQLVDTVTSMNLGGIALVLIDRPIDLRTRRQIAEIFHTETSGQNSFLLIDQVLFMYLALHQVTERLPVMLKCTLPYTTYQPFVRDGGSTADEMFCGRVRELATIIDPNGACVVYGGRQLGKTALLERAESRCSKPENKAYAVYSSIINCRDEVSLVEKIVGDINKKTDLSIETMTTINEFCCHLDAMFRSGKIASMMLLLDEADNFLGAISEADYQPLQPLVDLKRETKNNFKFVLAGLHNVCRAKNATEKNGVFGQLGTPLCIKPLSPTEALQLLSRPLRYLGFQIDRYPHLETILTNTNYYPGILQFFGYTLVQTLTSQYAKYYRAVDGAPPFVLQDEQLGAIMNSTDLNRSIRDKFRWSLELDPRYFMLARCITMLYYFNEADASDSRLGFSVEEIVGMCNSYQIHCLENETLHEYTNLLDEMVEMGILSKPKGAMYRLRRRSFVNIIGSDIDVLDREIVSSNEEGS